MRTVAQKPKATQQITSAKSTIPSRAHFGQSREVNSLLRLQRTIGNQATQWLLLHAQPDSLEVDSSTTAAARFDHDLSRIPGHAKSPITVQAKLTVNTPGDIYEQEADRVSEQVMRMPEPQLQRACACGGGCPECQTEQPGQEHERLQMQRVQASDTGQIVAPPIVHEVLSSPGQPLDPTTRAFMEQRFGRDFSSVRVHDGPLAATSADSVQARAYTVGRSIVFNAGAYAPTTGSGRHLLAHELTHVVQQSAGDGLHRLTGPALMRTPLFTSTLSICHRVLKSRNFAVSEGGVVVTANVRWLVSEDEEEGRAPLPANWKVPDPCTQHGYYMTLTQVGTLWNSEYGTCAFEPGKPSSRTWAGIPEDEYYLTIFVGDHNQLCCLTGEIEVSQQSGLSGASCTKPPPGPMEIIHTGLDMALVPFDVMH